MISYTLKTAHGTVRREKSRGGGQDNSFLKIGNNVKAISPYI